jgi:hypothetical protein
MTTLTKEKFIKKYGKTAWEKHLDIKRKNITAKTGAERKRTERERKYNFETVNLHLISEETQISGEVDFRFEHKPHKKDIHFNFYGLNYYNDVYEISPNGNISEFKAKPFWMGLIRNYVEENPTVKIIDEDNIEQQYEEVPWSVPHFSIIVNDEKKAIEISDLCKKYVYANDLMGQLKYPFNSETREEIEARIKKHEETNRMPKTMTCNI